jgi:hypothetical protein
MSLVYESVPENLLAGIVDGIVEDGVASASAPPVYAEALAPDWFAVVRIVVATAIVLFLALRARRCCRR